MFKSIVGKFGQRSGMDSFNYYREKDQTRFIQKIVDSRYNIKTWEIISPNCVELNYSDTDDSDIEAT